jgi:short subunit dehydrogenase-like uncharacterized protein
MMSGVNSLVVRRSNAVEGYSRGGTLQYRENVVHGGFMVGYVQQLTLALFGTSLVFPPLLWVIKPFLPSPGQGPSESAMDKGFLKVTAYATGSKGTRARAGLYFPDDPGYRDTARMLVEAGLCLALDEPFAEVEARRGGGVWTPASCLGPVLLGRLCATGTLSAARNL